jgi:glycosidase
MPTAHRYFLRANSCLLLAVCFLAPSCVITSSVHAQVKDGIDAPSIKKVEPPSWWVGLTPDVMLLLSGSNLQATHVGCNLQDVLVSRTQSSADGIYLFVWLKFGPTLKSGTAICRVTTPKGETTFELPLAAREQILGRNRGMSPNDALYRILPDRFANGDPSNDEPAELHGTHDRTDARSYHGGDLRGVREHLPYLNELGVTTVELGPVLQTGATVDYHNYGAVDLYTVDPHLGTLRDYQDLVEGAHKQHMKLFFDVAINHVGADHPWVKHPPMGDWIGTASAQHLEPGSPLGGTFYGQADNKGTTNGFLEWLADPHTPPQLRKAMSSESPYASVNLNTENPIVVEYLIQNGIWWTEVSGLDGYLIDGFPYETRKFWEAWHNALRRLYPRLSTVGDVFHPDPTVTSSFAGGRKGWDGVDTQLTALFDAPMYFAVRDVVLQGAPAGEIANVLRQDSLYPHPEYLVPFLANQDTVRLMNLPRADATKLKLALGLLLTLRGVPELYYGDEIGLSGAADSADHGDFPGGWQEDAKNAFTANGRTPEQQDVFQYVQALLRLRREHEALRGGKLWHLATDDSSYVFIRESEEERLLVAFNNSPKEKALQLSLRESPAKATVSVSLLFGDARASLAGRKLVLMIPARSISILELH